MHASVERYGWLMIATGLLAYLFESASPAVAPALVAVGLLAVACSVQPIVRYLPGGAGIAGMAIGIVVLINVCSGLIDLPAVISGLASPRRAAVVAQTAATVLSIALLLALAV